jgi:hypothetical protein
MSNAMFKSNVIEMNKINEHFTLSSFSSDSILNQHYVYNKNLTKYQQQQQLQKHEKEIVYWLNKNNGNNNNNNEDDYDHTLNSGLFYSKFDWLKRFPLLLFYLLIACLLVSSMMCFILLKLKRSRKEASSSSSSSSSFSLLFCINPTSKQVRRRGKRNENEQSRFIYSSIHGARMSTSGFGQPTSTSNTRQNSTTMITPMTMTMTMTRMVDGELESGVGDDLKNNKDKCDYLLDSPIVLRRILYDENNDVEAQKNYVKKYNLEYLYDEAEVKKARTTTKTNKIG